VYPNLIQNPEAPEEQTPVKGAITTIAMQTIRMDKQPCSLNKLIS